jgi:hypothetical protein
MFLEARWMFERQYPPGNEIAKGSQMIKLFNDKQKP